MRNHARTEEPRLAEIRLYFRSIGEIAHVKCLRIAHASEVKTKQFTHLRMRAVSPGEDVGFAFPGSIRAAEARRNASLIILYEASKRGIPSGNDAMPGARDQYFQSVSAHSASKVSPAASTSRPPCRRSRHRQSSHENHRRSSAETPTPCDPWCIRHRQWELSWHKRRRT
jgi:hypothetical protein